MRVNLINAEQFRSELVGNYELGFIPMSEVGALDAPDYILQGSQMFYPYLLCGEGGFVGSSIRCRDLSAVSER